MLFDPSDGTYLQDFTAFNEAVGELEDDLKRDMIAEGLDLGEMKLALELELRYGSSPVTQRIRCNTLRLEGEDDVKALYQDFRSHLMQLSFGVDLPEAPVRIETFALKGSIPTMGDEKPSQNSNRDIRPDKQDKSPAGEREVIWDSSLTRLKTAVFLIEDISEGDLIVGPAIGEAKDTTYIIPPGWELSVMQGGVCELRMHT